MNPGRPWHTNPLRKHLLRNSDHEQVDSNNFVCWVWDENSIRQSKDPKEGGVAHRLRVSTAFLERKTWLRLSEKKDNAQEGTRAVFLYMSPQKTIIGSVRKTSIFIPHTISLFYVNFKILCKYSSSHTHMSNLLNPYSHIHCCGIRSTF